MGQVMQEELVTWLSGLARLLLSHATVVRFSCGSKYCEAEDPSLVSESMLGYITHPSAETVWSEFSDNFNPFFGRLVFRGASGSSGKPKLPGSGSRLNLAYLFAASTWCGFGRASG
ncbi:hypothetical protein IGI04_035415 [Brassica rapa subsp. trilocularis]|uniref:Uncharacterized protein n=1 Tax=Brassica rapa subsp. trilocularis TaxID=1813537 RepID=A0ABQ7LDF2_BRACM|nr:hypothetical protein IGI04_035415 [Brassica rapa subsp. trilocularis]